MLLLYCLFPDSGCPKAEEETIFVIREQRSPHDGAYIIYLQYTAIHIMLFKRYDRKKRSNNKYSLKLQTGSNYYLGNTSNVVFIKAYMYLF